MTRYRRLQITWLALLVFAFALTLSACQTMTTPQTVREAGLQAYGSIAVVRSSAADLLLRDQLSKAQATAVLKKTDEVQTLVDAAMSTGDGSKLQSATAILLQIEAELKARQKP